MKVPKISVRTLPVIKQLLHFKAVHGREIGHFSGIFDSSEAALLSAPPPMRSTWDDDALVENGIPNFSSIHVFDWPVIYYLQQHVRDRTLKAVTDFGGHIGVKFTAYSQVIDFPKDLRWQVVETPAVINAARERVPREITSLCFFERLEDTAPCDVLISSGSMQYAGVTIKDIVDRMPAKPQTIILNKVPISRKKGYFTVERYIKSLAYRIYGPTELEDWRNAMGYSLTAQWNIPHRDIFVLHSRKVEHVEMVGEVWTLAAQVGK